jgi:hypothetical protein
MIAAALYLGGRPLSREQIIAAALLCCPFVENEFSLRSLDDRLVSGFECRLLSDQRIILERELRQTLVACVMNSLNRAFTQCHSPTSAISSLYIKHKKLFRDTLALIFDDFHSYLETINREFNVKPAQHIRR